jgi:hypothetical protein
MKFCLFVFSVQTISFSSAITLSVLIYSFSQHIFQGNALIIPAYDKQPDKEHLLKLQTQSISNGKPIKYLIHVPTMRVPKDVIDSTNAYLAFRGVILAGKL